MSHYCLREYVALRSFPTRRSSDLEAFAPLLAGSFARLLDLWRASDPGLLVHAWLARAHSLGTQLTVHTGKDETITGRFAGLEPDGALRLAIDGGAVEIVRAGDVALD